MQKGFVPYERGYKSEILFLIRKYLPIFQNKRDFFYDCSGVRYPGRTAAGAGGDSQYRTGRQHDRLADQTPPGRQPGLRRRQRRDPRRKIRVEPAMQPAGVVGG